MPILELPPKPAQPDLAPSVAAPPPPRPDDASVDLQADLRDPPLKLRTGRFGELEEHEIIHLLDALDDERAKARFRESIYISTIFFLALAWFLFYGPRILFHQPEYRDLISAMKEHDKQITYLDTPRTPALRPPPPARTVPDRKTLQQLQQQPRTPAAPEPAPEQAPPPPQEQAHTAPPPTPPVAQPLLPLPLPLPLPQAPSHATQALPDAPHPTSAPTPQTNTARDRVEQAAQGARTSPGGSYSAPSAPGRPQAGASGEILSDTMGVDFSAYMKRLHHDIQRNWDPLIPEEVQPPLLKKGITGIRFTILPGGQIGAMTLETVSGDRALDEAAWNSIRSEGIFPPLPKEFHGPQLELRVHFFYNIPIQQ